MAAKATRELNDLFTNALKHGLHGDEIRETVDEKSSLKAKYESAPRSYFKYVFVVGLVAVLLVLQVPKEAKGEYIEYYRHKLKNYFTMDGECLIPNNDLTLEMVRTPTNCKVCHNMTEVAIYFLSFFFLAENILSICSEQVYKNLKTVIF